MELSMMHSARKWNFTIFVDALFTPFKKRLFTKAFDRIAKMQPVLACGVGVSSINSPAT
jgi:hypothetical protein